MAEVALSNVTKLYPGGVKAVNDVSLVIRDQEFVVLVGPSGCGKSTTLRMVAGLEEISSGEIRIGGRVVNEVAPKDRDIAMVFQNYALYPHMTVYRNMAFALSLRRRYGWWDHLAARLLAPRMNRLAREERTAIDRRVRDAAALLGIEGLLDRRPRELSGGQRQRVAVGRAIVREPQAFLFDEPLSNLDARLRIELRGEIKRLHRRLATTTIYVTHDQEEAMSLGDRVVVMKDGVVQQVGPPLEVYAKPQNRFVAGFVGAPPMNFIEGALRASGDGLAFEGAGLRAPLSSAVSRKLGGGVAGAAGAVVLGVRPEHGSLRAVEGGAAVDLEIMDVEPLGDRADIRLLTPTKAMVTFRVDAREATGLKGAARIHLDQASIHIFESGGMGRNLTLATA